VKATASDGQTGWHCAGPALLEFDASNGIQRGPWPTVMRLAVKHSCIEVILKRGRGRPGGLLVEDTSVISCNICTLVLYPLHEHVILVSRGWLLNPRCGVGKHNAPRYCGGASGGNQKYGFALWMPFNGASIAIHKQCRDCCCQAHLFEPISMREQRKGSGIIWSCLLQRARLTCK